MLNLNKLNSFANKPKRVVVFTGEKSSQYENESVLLVKSVKNTLNIPKGVSQKTLGVSAKDSIQVFPHYFDAELTLADFRALGDDANALADKLVEKGAVMTGEELIAAIEAGSIQKLMDDETKKAVIASLNPEEQYPVITLVMKRDMPGEITAAEYEALEPEIKAEYNMRKGSDVAKLEGIMGQEGSFSSAAAYAELGGTCNPFEDKACTIPAEKVDATVDQYTKQLVFALSGAIDFAGTIAHVAYKIDEDTRKSKKGQERKSTKKEVVAENTVVEDTAVNNAEPQVEAPVAEPQVDDQQVATDDFEI